MFALFRQGFCTFARVSPISPFAMALNCFAGSTALRLLTTAGLFHLRNCKLCDDGVVVQGEYGLTKTLFGHNMSIAIATLMSMYHQDTDWMDEKNWHCNNSAHPSRHGSYDSITVHPFEGRFLKASWHVGEPHTAQYSKWLLAQAQGHDNTSGTFDEGMH